MQRERDWNREPPLFRLASATGGLAVGAGLTGAPTPSSTRFGPRPGRWVVHTPLSYTHYFADNMSHPGP